MVALPLISGVGGTEQAEFTTRHPLNLEPVLIDTNLSKGQLRAAAGCETLGSGPGKDRGGIVWNATMYRVMGSKLVSITQGGVVTVIGDVGDDGKPARLDYSFDRLGVRSAESLFLYDGTSLAQVTDQDLGPVKDMLWVDGYWMSTDGTHVIVTELTNPFEVKPLKYGSAEEDPDMVTGLMKVRGEVDYIGRNTIQPVNNVGGNGYPFQPNLGAIIPYGCVSATAKAPFADSYAFVGSARGESLSVRVRGQGVAPRISTRAVEDALAAQSDPTAIVLETRTYREEQRLFVHLETETWVFMSGASSAAKEPVWYRCQSLGPYRIRNAVEWNGRFLCGDLNSSSFGWLSEDVDTHFGAQPGWEFYTQLLYNEGKGALIRSVELVGLPGRWRGSGGATAMLSMSRDGRSWSPERAINIGAPGQTMMRMQWRPQARMTNYMGFRFRGVNNAMPGFARCELKADGLSK